MGVYSLNFEKILDVVQLFPLLTLNKGNAGLYNATMKLPMGEREGLNAKNTVISPKFLVWKFCVKAVSG